MIFSWRPNPLKFEIPSSDIWGNSMGRQCLNSYLLNRRSLLKCPGGGNVAVTTGVGWTARHLPRQQATPAAGAALTTITAK
jgi:hypothetical protein